MYQVVGKETYNGEVVSAYFSEVTPNMEQILAIFCEEIRIAGLIQAYSRNSHTVIYGEEITIRTWQLGREIDLLVVTLPAVE